MDVKRHLRYSDYAAMNYMINVQNLNYEYWVL